MKTGIIPTHHAQRWSYLNQVKNMLKDLILAEVNGKGFSDSWKEESLGFINDIDDRMRELEV